MTCQRCAILESRLADAARDIAMLTAICNGRSSSLRAWLRTWVWGW